MCCNLTKQSKLPVCGTAGEQFKRINTPPVFIVVLHVRNWGVYELPYYRESMKKLQCSSYISKGDIVCPVWSNFSTYTNYSIFDFNGINWDTHELQRKRFWYKHTDLCAFIYLELSSDVKHSRFFFCSRFKHLDAPCLPSLKSFHICDALNKRISRQVKYCSYMFGWIRQDG